MASSSSQSFNKTHLQDPNPPSIPTKPPKSKFHFSHYFFSKSLIIILVLLVFSFFPSQVPEFFKKSTIINKLWELIYLLVIGIAVCYGLFSKKIDTVRSCDDDIGSKETYLSEISHISSIFEDGVQSSYGFDEKNMFDECKGLGSSFSESGNGFANSDKKKLNQHFLGESMVVIDDETYVVEQLSKPKSSNKPLCLPVRSLSSKSLDSATVKTSNGGGCSSNSWDGKKNGRFKGLVPIKLEDKFKETDLDPTSPLKRRSKSMRLEKRDYSRDQTSHFKPNAVDVVDFEDVKSQKRFSMQSQMGSSVEKQDSKGLDTNHDDRQSWPWSSFMESKPQESRIATSLETNDNSSSKEMLKFFEDRTLDSHLDGSFMKGKHQQSSEYAASEMNNHGNSKKVLNDFEDGTLDSNLDGLFIKKKSQRSSDYASSETNNHGNSKKVLKDFEDGTSNSNLDGSFIKKKHQRSSDYASSEMNIHRSSKETVKDSNLVLNPAPATNTYKKGKSVRTSRPKEQVHEPKVKVFPSQTDDKVATNVDLDEPLRENDNLSDAEPHSGEVDRKAGEFIAKFRAQIRLQQIAFG